MCKTHFKLNLICVIRTREALDIDPDELIDYKLRREVYPGTNRLVDVPVQEYKDDWNLLKSRFLQLKRKRINSFTFNLGKCMLL